MGHENLIRRQAAQSTGSLTRDLTTALLANGRTMNAARSHCEWATHRPLTGTLGEDGEYDGLAETWWTSEEARTRALPRLQRDGFSQVAAKAETLVGKEIILA